MRGHVVRPLAVVLIVGRILGNRFVEMTFEIPPDSCVCIFVYGETRRGMLDKHLELACGDLSDFRKRFFA